MKMDSVKKEKLESSCKLKKSPSVKKALQILVPISLLSLFFSSSWLPWFLHLPNLVFTTLVPQFLNYIMNRKFMFLLCNGILVFLARESGLFGSQMTGGIDLYDEFIMQNRNNSRTDSKQTPEKKTHLVEKEEKAEEAPEQEEQEQGEEEGGGEEEDGDELNKRFEDYIKKVNELRRLEARQLVI